MELACLCGTRCTSTSSSSTTILVYTYYSRLRVQCPALVPRTYGLSLLSGCFFADVHPPLGLLILYSVGHLEGYTPSTDIPQRPVCGQALPPDQPMAVLRCFSAGCGIASVALMFLVSATHSPRDKPSPLRIDSTAAWVIAVDCFSCCNGSQPRPICGAVLKASGPRPTTPVLHPLCSVPVYWEHHRPSHLVSLLWVIQCSPQQENFHATGRPGSCF